MSPTLSRILAWVATLISTVAASIWAFWGILENFHEGWYARTFAENVQMMLVQYLSAPLLFIVAACVAIRWPRLGGTIHLAMALAGAWFFRSAAPQTLLVLIVIPFVLLAALYWFGRAASPRWPTRVVIGVPFLIMLFCGAVPVYRVATRFDDGDRSARRIIGNGVDLVWAPAGPGWPTEGVSWSEARRRCRFLSTDGSSLLETPQDIWRLPSVDEVVRSMQRHGENSGGLYDPSTGRVTYQKTPDKESPLWDIHSPIIYWWTADEAGETRASIIVYDGRVWPRPKSARWGYLAFRAVKAPDDIKAPDDSGHEE